MSRRQGYILATLCYIFKDDKVLMIKHARGHNKGKWNGVGGKFIKNETPIECLRREVREETGLIVKSPKLKGIIIFPEFEEYNTWLVFVFVATNFIGKLKQSDEGVLKWVKWERITSLDMYEGDKIFLEWIKEKNFFVAEFRYKNKKLVDYKVYLIL
ncbi:MAG: 8-oxo-dGTP diphosphatase [bacterium]|nr:8-oxo-dGTP diphosphatase [bacterium]